MEKGRKIEGFARSAGSSSRSFSEVCLAWLVAISARAGFARSRSKIADFAEFDGGAAREKYRKIEGFARSAGSSSQSFSGICVLPPNFYLSPSDGLGEPP